jgi:hypothetical protein
VRLAFDDGNSDSAVLAVSVEQHGSDSLDVIMKSGGPVANRVSDAEHVVLYVQAKYLL